MFSPLRALFTRSTRKLSIAAVVLAGYTVSACSSENILAPASEPTAQHGLIDATVGATLGTVTAVTSSLTQVKGLTWKTKATAATGSAVIGKAGGSITLGDVKLTVPAGAVKQNTNFQVIRLAGNIVAYDFEPAGTSFPVPLTLEISTANTTLASYTNPKIRGAYFPLSSLLDQILGLAKVSEFRNATVAKDNSKITFTVEHFSGYMVSMD